MNRNENSFIDIFWRHTKSGLLMMIAVIILSVAAGVVFYLTMPDADAGDELRHFTEMDSIDGSYSDSSASAAVRPSEK